ncbi:RING-type E3 ubiquitin-protein ligase PPIL2 isoform X2 [Exaiptasia diaphana]|uniref:RING-type E3 ubiquitin-protein ligase PPIL2 n=1 Tax=Exaiptasia diaphana TaxID=2652724 RepID=A0A913Y911_EXADI|nr:RING-type E3 ubiquitin-protein ligase PPIL2 isoform X2 [Exaiptasia diaphana]KXJ21246.1 Peptidyl-prolyl cis-trans isomerase-like 2 [Exaiptasia diaphana]
MGKKQHQKDKLYITNKEWREEWGGKKQEVGQKSSFRRLPFYCCSLSLQPFENPLCTRDGVIFDLLNIVPYLKKHKCSPVTGEPLELKDLTRLTFHKNADDKYHCPVTYKVFNANTNIVAIKTTGNVYCLDAVEELNLKAKNMRDLLTDAPFTRKDIITLQDPSNLDKFNFSTFHHLKKNLKADNDDEKAMKDPKYYLNKANKETESVLDELKKTYKEPEKKKEEGKELITDRNAAHFSTGAVAQSFTSTARERVTVQETAVVEKDVVRYREVKKKGYIRLQTNLGDLNLELHCDMVPKTCENFIKLCSRGYYDNTIFHRSIKHFMIQGGDPTGTGKGGESAWGPAFKDEFRPNLVHQGRGVLSMANSGTNTNKSQFFITFRSCRHLDQKHSVFGKLVGGMETLDAMERIERDEKDRPKETIKILKTMVFTDPFSEVDAVLEEEKQRAAEQERQKKEEDDKARKRAAAEAGPTIHRPGSAVGKYIPKNIGKSIQDIDPSMQPSKKKIKSSGFSDFSSW